MSRTIRFLIVLLLIMSLALVACDTAEDEEPAEEDTTEATATEAEAEEGEAEAAETEETEESEAIEEPADAEMTPEMTPETTEEPSIVEVAQGGDFSTLVAALDAAGLTDTLAEGGPYTVFAPTDDAFDAFLEAQDVTLDELTEDTEALADVLLYHVVEGEVTAEDATGMDGETVETLSGETLEISVSEDDEVMVNDATVVMADVSASNGIIHAIDAVLTPSVEEEEAEATAEATAEMTAEATEEADEMADAEMTEEAEATEEVDEMAEAEMTEEAEATEEPMEAEATEEADEMAEAEMTEEATEEPAPDVTTIVDVASETEDVSTLVTILTEVAPDTVETLDTPSTATNVASKYTVFAPTNEAFEALLDELGLTLDEALEQPELLQSILSYHVVPGAVSAETVTFMDGREMNTLLDEAIDVTVEDGTVVLNGEVNVVETDITAQNGVIHLIDGVLVPESAQETLVELGLVEAEATPEMTPEATAEMTAEATEEAMDAETTEEAGD